MNLDINLLKDCNELSEYNHEFRNCYNAKGLYNNIQFVLRLRPDIHAKINSVPSGTYNNLDFETVQAFSTYFHETIHWWQHIGSTSGLILSFTNPIQSHTNHRLLKDYLKHTGAKKPIIVYNEKYAKEFNPESQTEEFRIINQILNNFYDIEFYKNFVVSPSNIEKFSNSPFFENVGHSFHITYGNFISILSTMFDPDESYLPNAKAWEINFDRLRNSKFDGYYYGSPIYVPPLGLVEIYEGQARFSQIQYLYFGYGKRFSWEDFESLGMLSGIYTKAFDLFLKLTNSTPPSKLDDPLVNLFLLICDLAINPTDGFPFEIIHFESFIESVDPGFRFYLLCRTVAEKHPELKSTIKECSSSEYYEVSKILSRSIACPSPLDAAQKICNWVEKSEHLTKLMEEEKTFDFSEDNLPIRLIFSRFIRYQQDKLKHPAFFCWPGAYMAGEKSTQQVLDLFLEHQSLFTDKEDGDIYPRIFPDKDEKLIYKTFNTFYSWLTIYDLSRQWIVSEGEFQFDYTWLTSKYSKEELKTWSNDTFNQTYGVDTREFKVELK